MNNVKNRLYAFQWSNLGNNICGTISAGFRLSVIITTSFWQFVGRIFVKSCGKLRNIVKRDMKEDLTTTYKNLQSKNFTTKNTNLFNLLKLNLYR